MSTNDVAVRVPSPPPGLVPASMMEAMKLAEMMSGARLVPQPLQKSPADCLMVVMQAIRWQMDPFAVAQECSVIQGKLMHSGKLVAAVVNARGDLAERLSFTYAAQGDARTITVRGRLRGESEPREISVRFGDAKTQNKVWQSQPDQQLMYHGTRVWARRHTPELMLGVYFPEEFDEPTGTREPIDITPPAAPVDTAADLDAFAADTVVIDEQQLRETAEALAMQGAGAFRQAWMKLTSTERDRLRQGLAHYQALAATADATRLVNEERARDADPFGLPPLPEGSQQLASAIRAGADAAYPGDASLLKPRRLEQAAAEAPAVPFAAAVRALVPVAGDDGELDWRAWSEAFVALVEQATPLEARKCRLSELPQYGRCRTEDGDAAAAVQAAVNAKSKEAPP